MGLQVTLTFTKDLTFAHAYKHVYCINQLRRKLGLKATIPVSTNGLWYFSRIIICLPNDIQRSVVF